MRTSSCLSFSSFLALALSLTRVVSSTSTCYKLQSSIVGSAFFGQFNWETKDDPTNGRVNYLSLEESKAKSLTNATSDKFFMFPDSVNKVNPTARGRDSNRIISKQAFGDSVIILDIQHMPFGCATWPAFWTLSQKGPWPAGGEIDIIEGVNQATQNLISLHTSPNCTMPDNRLQLGMTASTNCDTNYNYNQGCGTQDYDPDSYGEGLNSVGGGFYALARSKEYGIKVWFWQRGAFEIPSDVLSNGDTVNPDWWGPPTAFFPTGDNCSYEKHFDAHQIVFDLTFCGDWAGSDSVWPKSGCSPLSCSDFVDQNPQAFEDAYWEINSLRIYTPTPE